MPFFRVFSAVLLLSGAAFAQAPETVNWTAQPVTAAANGKAVLTLAAKVTPGWHVYGLQQAPEGPTPLLVTLDKDAANGAVTGTKAVKFHDPAFGLDTQYYERDFTLNVPVKVSADARALPVSVRFQTCNGRICQPPKTVRLTAAVTKAVP